MAEGPLVHHYARRLHRALAGKTAEVEFGIKKLRGRGAELSGATVSRVEALGKQFRIFFDTGHIVLVHLLMWGSWGIYGKDEQWEKPEKRARLVIRSEDTVAVAFSAPIIRLYDTAEALQNSRWGNSGPDPLREDYSRSAAFRSIREQGDRPIGVVIMDQTVIAGVGNILRNEILFLSQVHPGCKVGFLEDAELDRILSHAEDLMRQWLEDVEGDKDWSEVYQRSGRPCPECGSEIEFFRQDDRVTYVCPNCQG